MTTVNFGEIRINWKILIPAKQLANNSHWKKHIFTSVVLISDFKLEKSICQLQFVVAKIEKWLFALANDERRDLLLEIMYSSKLFIGPCS